MDLYVCYGHVIVARTMNEISKMTGPIGSATLEIPEQAQALANLLGISIRPFYQKWDTADIALPTAILTCGKYISIVALAGERYEDWHDVIVSFYASIQPEGMALPPRSNRHMLPSIQLMDGLPRGSSPKGQDL